MGVGNVEGVRISEGAGKVEGVGSTGGGRDVGISVVDMGGLFRVGGNIEGIIRIWGLGDVAR